VLFFLVSAPAGRPFGLVPTDTGAAGLSPSAPFYCSADCGTSERNPNPPFQPLLAEAGIAPFSEIRNRTTLTGGLNYHVMSLWHSLIVDKTIEQYACSTGKQ
jgi:hypothetical protein